MTGDGTVLEEALHGASEVVRALTQPDLGLPTPCAGWSARDVLNHVVATTTKFTQFAEGRTDSPRTPPGDVLLEDPWLSFERCRVASSNAWRAVDPQRTCRLPFGTFSAAFAADINAFDVLVHTWDLARSVDAPVQPSCRLVGVGLAVASRLITREAVASGHYAQSIAARDARLPASWPDLLSLTGRTPAHP